VTDAYIYIRFSTPKQEDGSSHERQLEACRAFVERQGWKLIDVIEDLGRSAWKGDHLTKGNLGKFAKRIRDGEIPKGTVIVAENIDRFSRQKARVTQRWIEDICDRGLKIATVAGEKIYDAENLDGSILTIMEVLLLAEGANRYTENLRTRVNASYASRLRQAREQNTAIHSVGPAWLQSVGKRPNIKWEPIAERVLLIREMFDLTLAGKPPWAIARILNERPDCPSFGGGKWERTYIVKVLRSRAVEGDYVVGEGKNSKPTGEVLVGYYGPPIVPLDVVYQARAVLDQRRRGRGRNSGAINNLFGQKIRCGRCGGRMMQVGYQSRYLTCYEAARGNACTHKSAYKYRPFERAALDAILHLALDERFFRQAEKSSSLTLDIAATEKAILDKQAEANRAYEMWDRTGSATAEQKLHEAEAEIARLNAKLSDLNVDLANAQGTADAESQMRRLVGVREALEHPQDDIRLPARLRVSQALQAIVDEVSCAHHPADGEKIITMKVLGIHTIQFDNAGRKQWEFWPGPSATPAEWMEGDPEPLRDRKAAYFRRLSAVSKDR